MTLSVLIGIALVLLVVIMLLIAGGDPGGHGPQRHGASGEQTQVQSLR